MNNKSLPVKSLIFLVLMVDLGMSEPQNYQTNCYQRLEDKLSSPEGCQVTMQFNHPDNGLDWQIVTFSGQKYHYRNQGMGIEIWSDRQQKWSKVTKVDWFPGQEGVLCWDDFCADWRDLPLS